MIDQNPNVDLPPELNQEMDSGGLHGTIDSRRQMASHYNLQYIQSSMIILAGYLKFRQCENINAWKRKLDFVEHSVIEAKEVRAWLRSEI